MPTLDVIGALYDVQGEQAALLPGWHVNATGPVAAWAAHAVTPAAPRRQFAGVPTYCYSFDSREQFEALLAGADLSDALPPAVRAVTMRQARLWLSRAGLLAAVEAAVAAAPDSELRIWWDHSSEVHIDAPPLATLLPQLGISPAQLPAMFEAAAQL